MVAPGAGSSGIRWDCGQVDRLGVEDGPVQRQRLSSPGSTLDRAWSTNAWMSAASRQAATWPVRCETRPAAICSRRWRSSSASWRACRSCSSRAVAGRASPRRRRPPRSRSSALPQSVLDLPPGAVRGQRRRRSRDRKLDQPSRRHVVPAGATGSPPAGTVRPAVSWWAPACVPRRGRPRTGARRSPPPHRPHRSVATGRTGLVAAPLGFGEEALEQAACPRHARSPPRCGRRRPCAGVHPTARGCGRLPGRSRSGAAGRAAVLGRAPSPSRACEGSLSAVSATRRMTRSPRSRPVWRSRVPAGRPPCVMAAWMMPPPGPFWTGQARQAQLAASLVDRTDHGGDVGCGDGSHRQILMHQPTGVTQRLA